MVPSRGRVVASDRTDAWPAAISRPSVCRAADGTGATGGPPMAHRPPPNEVGRRGPAQALRPTMPILIACPRDEHGEALRDVPRRRRPSTPRRRWSTCSRRLRASTGATRVSVWVHEASTEMVVPFHRVVSASGEPAPEHPRLRDAGHPRPVPPSSPPSSATSGPSWPGPTAGGRRTRSCAALRHPVRSRRTADPGRRGDRRPHRRARRGRRPPPAAPGRPQARRRGGRGLGPPIGPAPVGAGRGPAGPDRVRRQGAVHGPAPGRRLPAARRARRGGAGLHLPARGRRQPGPPDGRLRRRPAGPGHLGAVPQRARSAWSSPRRCCAPASPWPPTGTPGCCPAGGSRTSTSPPASRSRWAARPHLAGVLTLDSTQVRPFSEDVRRLAAAAGAHLGGVIDQARTSQARATSLDDRRRRPAAAGRRRRRHRGRRGRRGRSPARCSGWPAPTAAPPTSSATTARSATVRHVDWPEAHKQVDPDPARRSAGRPTSPLWRRTAEEKLPVFVEDAAASELLDPRLVAELDLESYVSVPLLSGDRLLGLIVTGSVSEPRQLVARRCARPSAR